jgi:hypothetical protein
LTVGLAPFFDRARQSAAQVLRNFDPDAFERRLGEVGVTLAFDAQAAASVEGLASLDTAARLGEQFVREIAANVGTDVETLLPFAGLPLRAFRQKAICGNAIMRAADGGGPELEVPMAFQSALAGVMLAAEVAASTPGVRAGQPATRSVADLMRPLPRRITFPMLKGAPGPVRCICQDPDYVEVYRTKHGSGASARG